MIKIVAAGLLGAALGCAATLAGTRSGIASAAASTSFPKVDTKGTQTFQARRIAEAMCNSDGKAGGFVTLTAETPVFVGPNEPVPKGLLMSFQLRATCSGGPEGPLKSDAIVR